MLANPRLLDSRTIVALAVLVSAIWLAMPGDAHADRQRTFPDDNLGKYIYVHSAVYVPIDMTMTGPGVWAASVTSLARAGKSQWVEAGWYQSSENPTACVKPYACPFSSFVTDTSSGDIVDWNHQYENGLRPWFKVETEDCKDFGAWHGIDANWHLLTAPSFSTEVDFAEVISGLETSGPSIGFSLGYGKNTNRWTENHTKRITGSTTACNIPSTASSWDYTTIDPNEIPGTVTRLSGPNWRISVP